MRRRAVLTSAAIVIIVATATIANFYLLDGLDGAALALVYGDDATYAPGYTDRMFGEIETGMDRASVKSRLGQPLSRAWIYQAHNRDEVIVDVDARGRIQAIRGKVTDAVRHDQPGTPVESLIPILGRPNVIVWAYSRSLHDASYRVRSIVFRDSRVEQVIHEYYWD